MTPSRPWFRHVNYADVLAKWESGRFLSKAALARHFGIERGGMARLLRVAREEREAALNAKRVAEVEAL